MTKISSFIASATLTILLLSPLFTDIARADNVRHTRGQNTSRFLARSLLAKHNILRILYAIETIKDVIYLTPYYFNLVTRIFTSKASDRYSPLHRPYLDTIDCSDENAYEVDLCAKELTDSNLNLKENLNMCTLEKHTTFQISKNGLAVPNAVVSCCVESINENSIDLFCKRTGKTEDPQQLDDFYIRLVSSNDANEDPMLYDDNNDEH